MGKRIYTQSLSVKWLEESHHPVSEIHPRLTDFWVEDLRRYWSNIHYPIDRNDCWEWIGYKLTSGYGCMKTRKIMLLTHRIAYFIENKNIPKGMLICHHCDNPGCVNPDHLFCGTYKDNMRDMIAKKRNRGPALLGEKNRSAKLKPADIDSIRQEYTPRGTGERVLRYLSQKYGVSINAIHSIIHKKTWSGGTFAPPIEKRCLVPIVKEDLTQPAPSLQESGQETLAPG